MPASKVPSTRAWSRSTRSGLRVYASSAGDRLLAVGASWIGRENRTAARHGDNRPVHRHVLQVAIRQTSAAETYWQGLRSGYQQAVKDAQAAVQAYVVAFPAPKIGERPTEQTLELQNLNTAVTQGQAQLTNAESKIEEARLATQLARSQTGDGLQVVDPPEVPSAPEAVRREQALAVGRLPLPWVVHCRGDAARCRHSSTGRFVPPKTSTLQAVLPSWQPSHLSPP